MNNKLTSNKTKLIICIISMLCFHTSNSISQTHTTKKINFQTPFQGTKYYCTPDNNQTFQITITKNQVAITLPTYKTFPEHTFKGTIKNGIVLTNDPDEVAYRKGAGKYKYGKYYLIENDTFGTLNGENGDYSWFYPCTLSEKKEHDKKE